MHPAEHKYREARVALFMHINAGLRSAPTSKSYKSFYQRKADELFAEVEVASRELEAARDRGEIQKLPRFERLLKQASGHADNPSVQAARRILQRSYGVGAEHFESPQTT